MVGFQYPASGLGMRRNRTIAGCSEQQHVVQRKFLERVPVRPAVQEMHETDSFEPATSLRTGTAAEKALCGAARSLGIYTIACMDDMHLHIEQ